MNKKSQANQIFIYIIAAIVLGMIVLVGYMGVSRIVPQMCETSKITFEKNLNQVIKENRDYGASKNEQFNIPCQNDYQGLCFLSQKAIVDIDTGNAEKPINPTIINEPYEQQVSDSADVGAATNIFYITTDGNIEQLQLFLDESAPIEVDGGLVCAIPSEGVLEFRIKGLGRTAQVII
jgi:hypothetical protein